MKSSFIKKDNIFFLMHIYSEERIIYIINILHQFFYKIDLTNESVKDTIIILGDYLQTVCNEYILIFSQ